MTAEPQTLSAQDELTLLVLPLLRGVLYQQDDAGRWSCLVRLESRVRDYVSVLQLDLILDEAEGYAFLRSKPSDQQDGAQSLPRLIARRQLSFPVSLLLALLRRRMSETDASGGDSRLILTRDQIAELLRVFLPETTNETRWLDQVDASIQKVVGLGYLRRLRPGSARADSDERAANASYEVARILKAFVDAQWLTEFDAQLATYRDRLRSTEASHA